MEKEKTDSTVQDNQKKNNKEINYLEVLYIKHILGFYKK